jgi:phospholipid transport system substrate-binding protein
VISRRGLLGAAGLALLVFSRPSSGQDADPRMAVVQTFYDALLGAMKEGDALGFTGRYERLTPAIKSAFDISGMTERAIGGTWENLSEEERQGAIAQFERYMVATYASRFKSFSGQKFDVQALKESAGKPVVLTVLTKSDGEPVQLAYVMREVDGGWKIADVYYSGAISEVARLRSDFSSTLLSGGVAGLNQALEAKISEMGAAQ